MQIVYTAHFIKVYRKIPQEIKIMAEHKEVLFKTNPFDTRLKTHRLHGILKGCWVFSVNYQYRIIFDFNATKTMAIFHTIGNHDIYEK
ncbi:MAG: type II toxin-antitoxin system mRNA interferase toxin, RelE/StbE family [Patescibacteria group bacterium]